MATPIIAAIRHRRDLKESLLHTAQELAHRASIYGVVRVSYTYLAQKCHCSRRTALRHIERLEALRILRKRRQRLVGNLYFEHNTYTFVIPWTAPKPTRPSDTMARNLPPQEREKNTSLREELDKQKKGLRFWTPGTEQWAKTCEEIARLEGLLHRNEEVDSEQKAADAA